MKCHFYLFLCSILLQLFTISTSLTPCPATKEYNQVMGPGGIEYQNPSIMKCALKREKVIAGGNNISCYQCIKNTNEECGINDLRPCSAVSDRCVTHITKNADQGFTIKRECGLGPCGFDDLMMNKGIGWNSCDRSNDEYFCVFCCKESGCNKNTGFLHKPSIILTIALVIIVFLNIFERFQPPYVLRNEENV